MQCLENFPETDSAEQKPKPAAWLQKQAIYVD
jgi:hypothetical protein